MIPRYEGLTASAFVRGWLHESSRVIMDRLLQVEDKEWFLSQCDYFGNQFSTSLMS